METEIGSPTFYNWHIKSIHKPTIIHTWFPIIASNDLSIHLDALYVRIFNKFNYENSNSSEQPTNNRGPSVGAQTQVHRGLS